VTTVTITEQAQENRDYVRRLLREKLPEFAAMLASAERQLDQDLSHPEAGDAREPGAASHIYANGLLVFESGETAIHPDLASWDGDVVVTQTTG
jgi:hypothetical protein